jgi:hypothetical protein
VDRTRPACSRARSPNEVDHAPDPHRVAALLFPLVGLLFVDTSLAPTCK